MSGPTALLHCLTGFGGGLDDVFTTRSFALMVLLDAGDRLDDVNYQTQGAPTEDAERMLGLAAKARRLRASSVLHREVPDPRSSEEDWHREHVPRFIRRTRLLARHNDIGEAALKAIAEEIAGLPPVWPFMRAAWDRLHRFDLEVEATDSKYLAHLVSGIEFGTTAFDVWLEREPALPVQPEAHQTRHAQALEGKLDRLIESLLTKKLIELRPGKRPVLLKQLASVDADDELSFHRKILDVLATSKNVEELYGTDEELVAETRAALT